MIGFRRKRAGFTLIELLVVVAIIGVLAVLLMPAIRSARRGVREGATAAQIKSLKTSLQAFQNEWGELPNPTNLDDSGDVITLEVTLAGAIAAAARDVTLTPFGRKIRRLVA